MHKYSFSALSLSFLMATSSLSAEPNAYSGMNNILSKGFVAAGTVATTSLPTWLTHIATKGLPKYLHYPSVLAMGGVAGFLSLKFWYGFTADGLYDCAVDLIHDIESNVLLQKLSAEGDMYKKIRLHYVFSEYPLVDAFYELRIARYNLIRSLNYLNRASGRSGVRDQFINACQESLIKGQLLIEQVNELMDTIKKHPDWFSQMKGRTLQETRLAQEKAARAARDNATANLLNALKK